MSTVNFQVFNLCGLAKSHTKVDIKNDFWDKTLHIGDNSSPSEKKVNSSNKGLQNFFFSVTSFHVCCKKRAKRCCLFKWFIFNFSRKINIKLENKLHLYVYNSSFSECFPWSLIQLHISFPSISRWTGPLSKYVHV